MNLKNTISAYSNWGICLVAMILLAACSLSEQKAEVQSVELNGQLYEKKYITQQDIMQEGTLRFVMGSHHKKM